MAQAGPNTITRRALGAAVSAAMVAPPAIAAAHDEHAALFREADAVDALARNNQWEEWRRRQPAFLEAVEVLPDTKENATIKARAVAAIYPDGWDEFMDQETLDLRLAAQIVRGLVGD